MRVNEGRDPNAVQVLYTNIQKLAGDSLFINDPGVHRRPVLPMQPTAQKSVSQKFPICLACAGYGHPRKLQVEYFYGVL